MKSLLVILAAVSIVSSSAAQKKWPGIVLYSIEKNSMSGHYIIDPVVRIDKDKYSYPVPTPAEAFEGENSHEVLEGYFNRFDKEEYKKGRKLEVYINGNLAGKAQVTQLDTVNSCSPVISEVNLMLPDTINNPFPGYGLVIASAHPKKEIRKFIVDSIREASLLEFGKKEFQKRGVKSEIAEKAYLFELHALDLNCDGKVEFLATFFIIGEEVRHGEADMQYTLTALIEEDQNGYNISYSHYPEPGVPAETYYYHIVDVLDLGDGSPSLIIQKRNYSSWDYVLVKKVDGVWKEVYEGAGSGC